MKQESFIIRLATTALVLFCILAGNTVSAQIARPGFVQQVEVSFFNTEEQITQGDIISNVMKLVNVSGRNQKFRVSLDVPSDWRMLFHPETIHELAPGDSLFLPVRLIPTKQIMGNSRFMISAYVVSEDEIQLGSHFFWAFTQRKKSWLLNIEPATKNYFKNGSSTTSFKVNVLNTGSEMQPISLSLNNLGLYAVISDSNDKIIKEPNFTFNLKPFEDTTFNFQFKYINGVRNSRKIDIESHKPDNLSEEKEFSVIVNTTEPSLGGSSDFESSQKVIFMRLSDDKKVNEFGSARLPLVADVNVNNILSNTTFTTINLRGIATLTNERMLIYNYQTTTSTNAYESALDNGMYYAGYFYGKGSVQAGFINGGLMGIQSFGRGVRSDYYITNRNKVTAFYVNNEGLNGRVTNYSFGGSYETKYYKSNTLRLEYGRSESAHGKAIQDGFGGRVGFHFLKTQTINFQHSTSMVTPGELPVANKIGHFNSVNFTGRYFRARVTTNQTVGQSTRGFAGSDLTRLYYNQGTRYNFSDRRSLMMVNSYNETQNPRIGMKTYSQNNQLSLNFINKNRTFQPLLFYNRLSFTTLKYNSRGTGFSYSTYSPADGTRIATQMQMGYNKPYEGLDQTDKFFLTWSGFVIYQNITMNGRYNLSSVGNIGQSQLVNSNVTPQNFTGSIQHQYLFPNSHIMLQSGFNYYYNNVFNQHSISVFPELYYFTSDGWRFRVSVNYNIIKGDLISFNGSGASDEPETYVSQSTLIGLGIRKEFGIPIPFMKKKNVDVTFEAFYDMNGNGLHDKDEKPIENIIIGVGRDEVITNGGGEAHMRNFPKGIANFYAKSLTNYEGWFANIDDSLILMKDRTVNVPFVRGVKIRGKVNIDREAIRADADSKFDLSRIKISANGKKTFSTLTDFDGNFEMYLPYGTYTITMDEQVLGEKYKIARNNYEINSSREADGLFLSFLIMEKKRKIVKKVFTNPEPQAPAPPKNNPDNNRRQRR